MQVRRRPQVRQQRPRQRRPAPPARARDRAEPAPVSQKPAQNPDDSADSGVFVFRKQVEEVVLHATVIDDKQRIVTNLDKGDFNVFEDGRPQTITSFRHEDIPVAMGIVVDNSGSMREKRQKVNAAALNLVRASNPNDEVCVVNFNDEYYLDQDFTSNINKLKEGLEKIEARGGTALYDAVVASADQLKKDAKLEKKVIFVVTDGEDNESAETSRAGGAAFAGRERTNRLRHRHSGRRRAPQARQTRAANYVRKNGRHRFLSQNAGRR